MVHYKKRLGHCVKLISLLEYIHMQINPVCIYLMKSKLGNANGNGLGLKRLGKITFSHKSLKAIIKTSGKKNVQSRLLKW